MNEPCRHEREEAWARLGWVSSDKFAGTQRDTLTSFTAAITEMVKTRTALRVALAKLAHVQAICAAANLAGQDPTTADIETAIEETK